MEEKNLPDTFDKPSRGESEDWPSTSLLKRLLRENLLIFIFGFLGLVFLLGGIASLFLGSNSKESEIIIEENVGTSQGKIKVDVGGAVARPGVYELDGNSRIQEALILAGGLSSSADRDWVAKNLNLAAKLADGVKIYIPQTGEVKGGGSSATIATGGFVGSPTEKININSASSEELDKLPNVGPVTAQKIIAGRPYQTIEDLLNKKIVGEATFSKLKEQITVW